MIRTSKNTSAYFAVPKSDKTFVKKLRKYATQRVSQVRQFGRGGPTNGWGNVRLDDASWVSVYFRDRELDELYTRLWATESDLSAAKVQAFKAKRGYEDIISAKDDQIESLEGDIAEAERKLEEEAEEVKGWEELWEQGLRERDGQLKDLRKAYKDLTFHKNGTRILSVLLFLTYCAIAAHVLIQ